MYVNNKDYKTFTISASDINVEERKNISKEFSCFFKKHLKEIVKPDGTKFTREDIAVMLGMSDEQLKKIINMSKPTKKRDCIIAICILLKVGVDEANEALCSYNYMATLDCNNGNDRDDELIEIIENNTLNPITISIDDVNKQLENNNLHRLDIMDHRKGAAKRVKRSPFEIVKKGAYCNTQLTGDYLRFNIYDSLETEYSLDNYSFTSYMQLKDKQSNDLYELAYRSRDPAVIEVRKGKQFPPDKTSIHNADSIFYDYFPELQGRLLSEKKKIFEKLNDTRNYKGRISANIRNLQLHVFYEEYNYDAPELNEYYILEYTNNTYRLKISDKSMFMSMYLTSDEYTQAYGNQKFIIKEEYSSLEEINSLKELNPKHVEKLRHREKTYRNMQKKIDQFIDDIQSGKVYIRHTEYIFDTPNELYEYFGVTDDLYESDSSTSDTKNSMPVININLKSGETVVLLYDDIKDGFTFGLSTIEEIAIIKKKYGNIKAMIQ